jgi:peptidyl-prolyl cis-trans isomerase D
MNSTRSSFDKNRAQTDKGTYIVLLLALGAMVFFGVCNPQSYVSQLDSVAGSVKNDDITQDEFSRVYTMVSNQNRQQHGEAAANMPVARDVMEQLVKMRVLYYEAKRLGLEATEDEIVSVYAKIPAFLDEKGKFSQERYEAFLQSNRFSEASLMDTIKRELSLQKLQQQLVSSTFIAKPRLDLMQQLSRSKMNLSYLHFNPHVWKVAVEEKDVDAYLADAASEKAIADYYETNKSMYQSPERVHARHILISFKGANRATADAEKRTKEDARKRAEALLTEARKGGDFAALARKETDEAAGKKSGGDLGFFAREMMVKPFADAAFALNVGQISDIVESEFGFHIIKSEGKEPAKDVSVDSAKRDIAKALVQKTKAPEVMKAVAADLLAKLKAGENIDAKMAEHGLQWKDTGDFAFDANYIPSLGRQADFFSAYKDLREPNALHSELVNVKDAFYIVKLKSRQVDATKLDEKMLDNMARMMSMRQGYQFMQEFSEAWLAKLEEEKAIYRNPQYLALDERKPDTEVAK